MGHAFNVAFNSSCALNFTRSEELGGAIEAERCVRQYPATRQPNWAALAKVSLRMSLEMKPFAHGCGGW